MKAFGIVFGKEIRDSLRDRRSLSSALLIAPLIGPVLMVVMLSVVLNMQQERVETRLQVPVVGAENAPNLIDFLKQKGTKIEPAPEHPEQVVLEGTEPMVLVIPESYGERFTSARPAVVTVIQDQSRRNNRILVSRLVKQIHSYSRTVGALRLTARGVDPSITQAVVVRAKDMSTPESRGAQALSMMPYFLMFALFMGGMYLAIDSTAGERERHSLEPLLLNPAGRSTLMLGKLAATVLLALVSLVLTIVAFTIAMNFLPLAEMGVALTLDLKTCTWMFLVIAPVALVAGSLEVIIAAFAKSFREAQTYVTFVFFLPLIPMLGLMLVPVDAELWMMTIPVLSQGLLLEELLRGVAMQPTYVVVSVVSTLIVGAILAAVAAGLYRRERLAFSAG